MHVDLWTLKPRLPQPSLPLEEPLYINFRRRPVEDRQQVGRLEVDPQEEDHREVVEEGLAQEAAREAINRGSIIQLSFEGPRCDDSDKVLTISQRTGILISHPPTGTLIEFWCIAIHAP